MEARAFSKPIFIPATTAITASLTTINKKSKQISAKLNTAGATTSETAVTAENAKITSKNEMKWLTYFVETGKVGKTKDQKYWWK
jgi:hypothetical protein